ncbi:MAG: L-asparaginase [Stygiobacter sp. RIFOXYC12_FULL_38_8]|nr:MAG: L-asparaginase [Stygiobacter sp. GWC2_38_9]OGU83750.1 MAG: L-asparaginase [Stygiobacter sp. RIFOXYA12_FULL_38_9]OGV07716.1 MAG: L-asparaginase [Stygiobacter sp. RIFOXYB2_FULL_37_11]OGV12719.1 MAG: L-asparaginase [Stygiobacter sp. RIFOXYC2_FULL_38_25]OGV17628.1 MAG: L-asparaginase [Stygiobacter sp. RIFOXYA2_FULL_38_8]OGV26977.1 MAG: L-asparaginase [Stygiobacter sp. RIFOXYC12_FULL_38_8]OGV82024.1 MAG: L-asparaginase [Stygiobacter sp. GWF2_38_21]
MKNVLIVFTGGTFSMKIDEKTKAAVPFFQGEELVDMIPEARGLANLSIYEFGNYPGPHITPQRMLELSEKINSFIEQNTFDGIIVTHGTDTLEETAYFLDLTLETKIPIVVIGAMKTSSEPDWDAPRNLVDAIHIINNPNSKGFGVLVCLNGEINAASEVTKTHTEDVETFHSLDFGSLGFVEKGKVWFNRLPRKLETLKTNTIISNVDLIKVYAGMNEKFFRFSADSGVEGIVVEAMGVGNVPPEAFEGIKYAVEKGIPTVLVSRCPAGETLDIYGYPGAGKWLKQMGVIFADYLNGQKARIKLMICLGITKDKEELRKMFE